jgi:hypothetical protein
MKGGFLLYFFQKWIKVDFALFLHEVMKSDFGSTFLKGGWIRKQ